MIFITGIDRKFPNLISLDLKQNKIYSMEAINVLYECKHLAEVNYIENPICVHRDLIHMVEEAAPQVEIVNKKEVRPVAHKFKQLIGEVREQVKELKRQPLVKDEETGEYVETPLRDLDVERFL